MPQPDHSKLLGKQVIRQPFRLGVEKYSVFLRLFRAACDFDSVSPNSFSGEEKAAPLVGGGCQRITLFQLPFYEALL